MHPRPVIPVKTYLLTRRCIERRFLLRPSKQTNQILEYCLAVAAERTGVDVHCFCAMSNHVHAVVTDVDGRLPEFLQFFHRHVAVAMNASLARGENFWAAQQASAVELGDAFDVLDKLAYVVANPTAAGLVKAPQQWPGVVTRRLGERRVVDRPDVYFRTNGTMPERATLEYTVPPQLRELDPGKPQRLFFSAVAGHVRAARTRMAAEGRTFIGAEAVLKQRLSRAAGSKEKLRGGSPRFAMRDRELRKLAKQRRRAFLSAYQDALARWREGVRDTRFPEGTWLMRRLHRVTCGPPLPCAA